MHPILFAQAAPPPPIVTPSLWSVLPTLLIFFLLAGIATWVLVRRPELAFLGKKPKAQGPELNILATRSLGNRQFLLIVGCDKQRFLLGISPGSIQRLATLEHPESGFDTVLDEERSVP